MSLPPSKHLAVIAAAVFVLAVSLLVLTSSGYDGEDGAEVEVQTTDNLSEAKAVIFDTNNNPTYYKSIQGAIDAAETNAKVSGINAVTIYVTTQIIDTTIDVGYVQVNNSHSLLEVTIKGLSINENGTSYFDKNAVVELSRVKELTGPMFRVEGWLVLNSITIQGNGGSGYAMIEVIGKDPSTFNGELVLSKSTITNYNGVAIDVVGGVLTIDEESKITTSESNLGVITATTSFVALHGSVNNTSGGPDGYDLYANFDKIDNGNKTGYGLYVYQEALDITIDFYIGYTGSTPLLPGYGYLNVLTSEDSTSEVVSGYINITLKEGFPLGTSIVNSEIGSDIIAEKDYLGWVHKDTDYQCYLITPVSDDFVSKLITDGSENNMSGRLIVLKQGDDFVFSGITDDNGNLDLDPELQGAFNLFIDSIQDSSYGSVRIESETDEIEVGSRLPSINADVEVYIWTIDSLMEGPPIEIHEIPSTDVSAQAISEQLSARQEIVKFISIEVSSSNMSMVFSLELPQGIDPDQAIVFREHSNEIITSRIITNAYGGDASTEVSEFQRGNPYAGSGECFTVESIGGKNYVTIRAEKFSVYALGYESPAPSPPPERTVVNAAIEDRQVRITVGPESYKEYAVRDVEGDLLLGWESGASGLTISFDLLPPGFEYRVMGRYAGTTSEILEATIVAPKDPVIEVVSVWVDGLTLSTEEMVEYRLLLEDGTPVGSWIPGDGEDGSWTDLDPTLDYYAEATSTSDGMTLSTGPVLVKEGVSTEVTGVVKHGGMYLVVSSLDQGWSCSADAEVYSSSGTSVIFGPLAPGTVTLSFTDGEEVRDMDVIVPEMPQDSEDDADTIVIEAQDGVMYRLHDHTGAVVSDGWVDGGGTLTWDVDPLRGYFVTMITGNGDGTVMFPMTEVKRPAEMISPTEGA